MGVPVQALNKIGEGSPHVLDWIERGDVDLVVNTPTGVGARTDGWEIRRAAVAHGIPCLTTLAGGRLGGARDRERRAATASRRCCACRSCTAARAACAARATPMRAATAAAGRRERRAFGRRC